MLSFPVFESAFFIGIWVPCAEGDAGAGLVPSWSGARAGGTRPVSHGRAVPTRPPPPPRPATPHSGLGASSPSPHGHCPGAGGFCVARNALPPSDSPNESRGRCLLFSPHTSCYGDGVATQSHLPAAQPPCGLLCARGLAEGLSHRVLGSRTCDYVWPWASSRWLQLRRVPGVGDLRTAPTLMTMTTLAPPTSAGSGPV